MTPSYFHQILNHIYVILGIVFRRLKERGIKINPAKCKFFQKKVNFLGRVITEDGYQIDSKNISTVTSLSKTPPNTVHDLRHLLGLLGYYRKYVQNFSKVAHSLFQLLKKDEEKGTRLARSLKITWTAEHQQSLEEIVRILTNPPTLSYPGFSSSFVLHIDASSKGLGCALYQKINGEIKILGYGSRTLSKAEQKYHSSKLEFLGLKWAVTEHFRDYLFYAPIVDVYTDNNPLVYVLSSAKLNATGQRWVNQLADFNLNLHYKPGKSNTEADYFSRFPQDISKHTKIMSQDEINKLMKSVTENKEDMST